MIALQYSNPELEMKFSEAIQYRSLDRQLWT